MGRQKNTFKRGGLFLCACLFFVLPASATWSIIVVDPITHEIGIAGASCTYSVYGIGAIAPGKGAIIVQAMSNNEARAKGLQMIIAGHHPAAILKALMDPMYDPEQQQYAILCLNQIAKPQVYTGTKTTAEKCAITASGISVQGNTLVDRKEVYAAMKAAVAARKLRLPIQTILMQALEAGAKLGGDKRCGNRKAASAFLTVAREKDNPDHPFLNLVIFGNDEQTNAVEALRAKFEEWKARGYQPQ